MGGSKGKATNWQWRNGGWGGGCVGGADGVGHRRYRGDAARVCNVVGGWLLLASRVSRGMHEGRYVLVLCGLGIGAGTGSSENIATRIDPPRMLAGGHQQWGGGGAIESEAGQGL
eukprot:9418913-Prorocentrum_lima.AAC.1